MKNSLCRNVPLLALVAALGAVGVISPARADFQWVAPADSAPPVVSDAAPVVVDQAKLPDATVVPPPSDALSGDGHEKRGEAELAPLSGSADAAIPVPLPPPSREPSMAPASPSLALPHGDKAVMGFANNVPLPVALRQVLPADVTYTLSKDVEAGTLVSWQGGSSWHSVAEAMLSGAGLAMREQGKAVTVVKQKNGAGLVAPSVSVVAPSPPALSAVPTAPAPSPLPVLSLSPSPLPPPPPPVASPPSSLGSIAAAPVSLTGGAPSEVTPHTDVGRPMPPVAAESAAKKGVESGVDIGQAWTGNRGDTLRTVLTQWCRRAGIEMNWQAEYDYPLQVSVTLAGSFEDAVRGLLLGFEGAKPQPYATLYANAGAGQTVLVVQVRGNNYSD